MRCLIVGAGIVGICSALQLQRESHEVVVIDRNGPAEGASRGNAGIFAISHVVPIGTPAILKRVPAMLVDSTSPLARVPARADFAADDPAILSVSDRTMADPVACREHAAPGRGDLACACRDPCAGAGKLSAAAARRGSGSSRAAPRLAHPL